MPSRRSRPQLADAFGTAGIVLAIVLGVGLVAVVVISWVTAPPEKAGLAAPSQSGSGSQPSSPAPGSSTAPPSHARHTSASARRTHASSRPAPAPTRPAPTRSHRVVRPRQAVTGGWIITKSLLSKITKLDGPASKWFFNSPHDFVKGSAMPGLAATPLASYTSYAQFAQDLADGSFPAEVKWVMFGLESTTNSPEVEKQNPALYLKDFALLAHRHGLHVIEVPGRDLVGVPGAACRARPGEKFDQAFLRCHIPADAADADVVLIEAQGDQSDAQAYSALVTASTRQVRAVAPGISVMSGLTTDRGNSVAQILACWQATHAVVSGYWMNSSSSTLPVAAQVFNLIRAASG